MVRVSVSYTDGCKFESYYQLKLKFLIQFFLYPINIIHSKIINYINYLNSVKTLYKTKEYFLLKTDVNYIQIDNILYKNYIKYKNYVKFKDGKKKACNRYFKFNEFVKIFNHKHSNTKPEVKYNHFWYEGNLSEVRFNRFSSEPSYNFVKYYRSNNPYKSNINRLNKKIINFSYRNTKFYLKEKLDYKSLKYFIGHKPVLHTWSYWKIKKSNIYTNCKLSIYDQNHVKSLDNIPEYFSLKYPKEFLSPSFLDKHGNVINVVTSYDYHSRIWIKFSNHLISTYYDSYKLGITQHHCVYLNHINTFNSHCEFMIRAYSDLLLTGIL